MSKKDKLSTEPYKGVRDFYPEEQAFLNYFIATCKGAVERAGYVEYHASVLEPAELYRAKGAQNEELAGEQTYTFEDRGGRMVTLRPEMTPTVARMVAARRRELGFPLRLYSIPNVFRYERPQRGRLREHWQLNVDLFGSRSPAADAEILAVAYGVMAAFGATEEDFTIRVGSRPLLEELCRELGLDEEKAAKLRRLLDAKNKMEPAEFSAGLAELGVPEAALSPAQTPADIARMLEMLKAMGMGNVVYDPAIVRGFDYYTGLVFEVFDNHPQNNRALFGGGRYDNLTELFDSEQTPGVGFGMGDVTMRDFLEVRGLLPQYRPATKVYLAVPSPELAPQAQVLAGELRRGGVNTAVDFGEKKLADQLKVAAKHRIPYCIVVGENELSSGTFVVRNLETGAEESLERSALAQFFTNL
jgi:histidyl-tRNA synthetase